MPLELLSRPKAAQLEDLRSVEGAASDNDFLPGADRLELSTDRRVISSVGLVHGFALEILDTIGLWLSTVGGDQHLCGEAVGAQRQGVQGRAVSLLGRERFGNVVPRTAPAAVLVDVKRDLVHTLDLVAIGVGSVHVSLHAFRNLVCIREGDIFGISNGVLADA